MIDLDSNQKMRLLRLVSTIGNGAHVFVPKEWIGEQVELVRIESKKDPEELILNKLRKNLKDIEGLYLTGSHARGEAGGDSDVDVLAITNKKIIFEEIKNIHIVQVIKDRILFAIKQNPVLIYSMLAEAKPIINDGLLDELREKYIPRKSDFKSYIKETKEMLKINLDLLEGEEKSYNANESAYSIILRLRGIYLIKSLLQGRKYNSKILKEAVLNKNIDYYSIYSAYNAVKNDKKDKILLNAKDLIALIYFIEDKIKEMQL